MMHNDKMLKLLIPTCVILQAPGELKLDVDMCLHGFFIPAAFFYYVLRKQMKYRYIASHWMLFCLL